jgi:hypothetical protein
VLKIEVVHLERRMEELGISLNTSEASLQMTRKSPVQRLLPLADESFMVRRGLG